MAGFHVMNGVEGINAGTMKKSGREWLCTSDVTTEAIIAVMAHMYLKIPDGENRFTYGFVLLDGTFVSLTVEASHKYPDWAREIMEKQDGTEEE